MKQVNVGLIGSQFISTIHAEALKRVPVAEVLAVASPTEAHVRRFAEVHGIPHIFTDYRKMLEMDELGMIVLGLPTDLHAQATLDAARAGKHVVCEKPLCRSLREADAMIEADGDEVVATFDLPQRAITPGQAVVFYTGDVVVGGGWIA